MKRITHLVVAATVAAAGLAMLSSPARAQGSAAVTITFRLTLNGTVPPNDSFVADWPNGIGALMCARSISGVATCVGGHTYTVTFPFGKSATPIQFFFLRFESARGASSTGPPKQRFGQQTVVPNEDRTVSAFFTFGTAASVQAPATGGAASFPAGAGLVAAGTALLLVSIRRRDRSGRAR